MKGDEVSAEAGDDYERETRLTLLVANGCWNARRRLDGAGASSSRKDVRPQTLWPAGDDLSSSSPNLEYRYTISNKSCKPIQL